MKKIIIFGVIAILIIIGAVFYFTRKTVPSAVPAVSSNNITITNFSFNPANVIIKKGETVTWTNNDNVSHTITGDNNSLSGGPLSNGQSYSFTFNQTGTFNFHCSIHPSMNGSVIVTE